MTKRFWVQFMLPELADRGFTEEQQRSHPQGPFVSAEAATEWAKQACLINGCSQFRVYTFHRPGPSARQNSLVVVSDSETRLNAAKAAARQGREGQDLADWGVFERRGQFRAAARCYWALLKAEGWQIVWTTGE